MSLRDALAHHVERRLRVDLELDVPVEADEDGDYVYEAPDGPVVWIQPALGMRPASLRVGSIAATGVKKTAALLTELNAWNDRVPLVRFVWDRGAIRVWSDAIIMSVEPGELGHLVKHVAFHSKRISDIACAVYGGTAPWALSTTAHSEDPA